jgi:membrane fusion protein, macrolide-specific efflux system
MSKMKLPKAMHIPRTKGGRVFAVIVILVIAGLAAYFIQGAVSKDDTTKTTYTTGAVAKMTLTSSVSGEGNIEWLSAEDATTSHSGTVKHMRVTLGQKVEEDQKLFTVGGYWVRAPIDGTITALNVAQGDDYTSSSSSSSAAGAGADTSSSSSASSSASSTSSSSSTSSVNASDPIATVIDLDAFRAAITIAESDISSVKVGQKAVITFDALPDLTLTGKVKTVDYTGTNTSGVVSYAVTVVPDTPNASVRGGMTVSVNIITNVATDVLAVPAAAVKTASDGTSYVQVLGTDGLPADVTVETGMTTDSYIQITSGLTEGQTIIVSTSKSGSTTATTTSSSNQGGLLNGGGGFPGGGFPSGGGFPPPGQ